MKTLKLYISTAIIKEKKKNKNKNKNQLMLWNSQNQYW
jgi:hypothetical protein